MTSFVPCAYFLLNESSQSAPAQLTSFIAPKLNAFRFTYHIKKVTMNFRLKTFAQCSGGLKLRDIRKNHRNNEKNSTNIRISLIYFSEFNSFPIIGLQFDSICSTMVCWQHTAFCPISIFLDMIQMCNNVFAFGFLELIKLYEW